MDSRVTGLESQVRELIQIPEQLVSNCSITTTSLGGVFLEYASDARGGVHTLNSAVRFIIYFDTTDGFGRYEGQDVGLEFTQYRNIKPMRAIKKKISLKAVMERLNKWLKDNEAYLLNSIQFKG